MANRKRSGRPPQPQHANKSTPSQHDKRSRLAQPNPGRRSTNAASVPLVGGIAELVAAMSRLLDKRIAFRLPIVIAGAMLATDSAALSSLEKTSTINFYCCKNADSILPACTKLPLISVGFELTGFSPQSVKILGAIPTLSNFIVEQNLDPNQVAAMKLLPSTVAIRSSFPMDAYD